MRNNLLSLQGVSRLQDVTSNRLSTGLKVNSAIDNPSSFYTAQSLSNRAADLNSLLDSMSQGVQLLKAASQSLEAGVSFLQQAKAVAGQAMDMGDALVKKTDIEIDYSQYTKLPKDWYSNQVGADGVVVETAQELRDAINAGTKTIVVYGKIDLTNQNINTKPNQKIVGTEYFADIDKNALYRDSSRERFSQINVTNTTGTMSSGVILESGSSISDIKVSLTQPISYNDAAIMLKGNTSAHNVDAETVSGRSQVSGILAIGSGAARQEVKITGNINIKSQIKSSDFGIYVLNAKLIADKATINIDGGGIGIIIGGSSSADIKNTTLSMKSVSAIVLNSLRQGGNTFNIGNDVIINAQSTQIFRLGDSSINNPDTGRSENIMNIAFGTKVYWHKFNEEEQHNSWIVNNATTLTATNDSIILKGDNFQDLITGVSEITDYHNYKLPQNISRAYLEIIKQYNALIDDASYKGVNLLKGDTIKINFNEDRSSTINIKGVDASAIGLGLGNTAWSEKSDVEKSIAELDDAIGNIRAYSSEFGNNYNIVSSREDFTKAMINVLEEGADKLTLADMNQESANMLALQTRQMLAINSLSLANQASQSVLKLF